jgi:hypothetical protein
VGTPACSWGNNLIPPRHQILATGISLDGHSPTCVGRGLEPTQLALCASTSAYLFKIIYSILIYDLSEQVFSASAQANVLVFQRFW